MINDGSSFKIVHSGYGAVDVQDCTVDNAMAFLKNYLTNLNPDIMAATSSIRENTNYIVNTSLIVDALKEILSATLGQGLPKVARLLYGAPAKGTTAETIVFEAEYVTKVISWAQANGIAWAKLNDLSSRVGYELEKMNPTALFLLDGIYKRAGARKPMFLEASVIDISSELAVLEKNTWKPTAKESSVVQRYLTFINENLMDRNERVDLGAYTGSSE